MEAQVDNFENILRSEVESRVRVKRDFPKPGVSFLDFNKCLLDPFLLDAIVNNFLKRVKLNPGDVVLAPEARGFILGPLIANKACCSFIPLRKRGKLPDFGNLQSRFYTTEYSKEILEMDLDLAKDLKDKNVVIYDDVLASGGTAVASALLAELFQPKSISFCFLAEIKDLKAREFTEFNKYEIYSLLKI